MEGSAGLVTGISFAFPREYLLRFKTVRITLFGNEGPFNFPIAGVFIACSLGLAGFTGTTSEKKRGVQSSTL